MNLGVSFSNKVSFGQEIIYKGHVIPNKQDNTHDVLRAYLEEQLGGTFFDAYDINHDTYKKSPPLSSDYFSSTTKPKSTNTVQVDENKLRSQKIYAFKQRRKNELYSGESLYRMPDKLKVLKEAGIKSVYSLIPNEIYQSAAEENGLNFYSLFDEGISSFDLSGDLLVDLINNPTSYAKENHVGNKKLEGLQNFVKTLNGENKDMPLPIYFGCQCGTDRTELWYRLYMILKDCPMDKPLETDTITELAKLWNKVYSEFRF